MTNELSILVAARAVIKDPAKWTQGRLARDAAGEAYDDVTEPNVTCYCAFGALCLAAGMRNGMTFHRSEPGQRALDLLEDAALRLFPETKSAVELRLTRLNDDLGHEAVMSVFSEAILNASVSSC
jgi:hypothetical protein